MYSAGRRLPGKFGLTKESPTMRAADSSIPLIAHVIFRLDYGGLENGVVNLINGIPGDRYRHAIICIDDFTDFSKRLQRPDTEVIAIHKRPGTDLGSLLRLYRTFRRLRPDIVHTRNLAGLDALLPALLAGVKTRIHGEHGWDVNDLEGKNRKLRLLRRLHAPLVSHYIALSRDIGSYLQTAVGVKAKRISRIYNGVDNELFAPAARRVGRRGTDIELPDDAFVFGFVGRVEAVKAPLDLVEAFARLVRRDPARELRLAIAGDGSLLEATRRRAAELGVENLCWFPGRRDDVARVMQAFDVFVLPSLAEGISNTILEAMASGLPVVATAVGGNPELVGDGESGKLVPAADIEALCDAMTGYFDDHDLVVRHGNAARQRIDQRFSLDSMIARYLSVYDASGSGGAGK